MLISEETAATSVRLALPTVLVAAGDLDEGEAAVVRLLEEKPDDLEALSLLAKIKHIRGELSEAFACWARLRAAAPQGESARMRLLSLLQLARDPERGAGDFLVLGRDQLWRKPTALLELERVFQLFVKRQPDASREAAAQLARKNRGVDAEAFKLARLAEALVAELAGDLEDARGLLEDLGQERGFHEDLDRTLALVRIYEALGGSENLERAANICEYLTRTLGSFGEIFNLGRLSAIYRALGRAREADEYDARFLAAFRRGMHRPQLADLTAVGAEHYVPLARLRAVKLAERGMPREPRRRRRAIALALRGELETARDLFAAGGELLDRKYLADVLALGGDRAAAAAVYLEVLAQDPDDPLVVGWLLDHAFEVPAGVHQAIAARFRESTHAERTRSLLVTALRERPLRAALWRRLASLERLLDRQDEATRCSTRADTLEESRRRAAIGRALSAAVYHFVGQGKGLVHELWVERRPAPHGQGGRLEELLGNLTAEMLAGVRNTFVSVREYARAKLPHQTAGLDDFNYAYKVTKEDEPSGGLSAGLPSALAFLSVFLGRPVPQDIASSGVLVADAHDVLVVRPVAEAEQKVRAAYNRDLRMLLLPHGNRPDLEHSAQVPRAVSNEVVSYVSNLDAAVNLVFGPDVWLS